MYVNNFFSCVYFSLIALFVGDGDTCTITLLDMIIYKCRNVMNNALEGLTQALKTDSTTDTTDTTDSTTDTKTERAEYNTSK